MNFNKMLVVEHFPHDRCGLHQVQAKSRNDCLVSCVSKDFSIRNAEALRGTEVGKDFKASKAFVVSAKRDRTASDIDVNVEMPFDPFKPSRKTNQGEKSPSPS